MKKLVLLIVCLMVMGSVANAQVTAGLNTIFYKSVETNYHLGQDFENSGTLYEGFALVNARGVALRGYHLFNKSYSIPACLPAKDKNSKPTPANLDSNFFASRIEMGLPFYYHRALLEPFVVNSYTKNYYTISGDKVNYSKDLTNITPGFGVAYSQIVAGNQNVSAKYFLTPKDSYLNLQYSWFNSKSSMGIGYTFRTYDNIRISGPFLNVSLVF